MRVSMYVCVSVLVCVIVHVSLSHMCVHVSAFLSVGCSQE